MRNALVSWTLPTTRESGGPLAESEISGVEISLSADLGANFTVLNLVPLPGLTLLVPDLVVGDYIFRGVWVDTAGRRSVSVDAPLNVPDETPPSSGTLQVTLA